MSRRKKDKKRRRARRQRAPSSREQRVRAAVGAELLAPGSADQDLVLIDFELHWEPIKRHSSAVQPLAEEAVAALNSGDGARAERLLERALELEPDQLALLNNLASAHLCQGRFREGEARIRDMHARHPDYLFGRVNMSQIYVREGRIDKAEEMLRPLFSRRRLHFTEFGALCMGQLDLFLARGQRAAARQWLQLWEQADPDHPLLEKWRRRVNRRSWWRRLLGKS